MPLKPLQISLGYALLSALWILFSDKAVLYFFADSPATMVRLSMIKGWAYVAFMALLLWWLLRRAKRALMEQAKALHESEQRYRIIVETASEGIEGIDADMRIVFVNQARAAMLGYTPDEMLGHRPQDFIFPEDISEHAKFLARRKTGQADRYARRLRHKDGSEVWAIVSASPWMSESGEFLGSFATFTNVSSQKTAEKELLRSREFLHNVVDNVADPIFVKDSEHRFVLVNQAVCALTGRTREEMLGRTDGDFFPEAEAKAFQERDRAVLESGITDTTEETISASDGTVFTISTRKSLFVDGEGRRFIVGVIRDMTERNRAVQALRQSEETFRNLFESSSDAILLMTPEGVFTACNQACLPLIGATDKSELIGKTSLDVSPPYQPGGIDTAEAARAAIAEALEKGVKRMEWQCVRRDGSPLLLDITLLPITIDGRLLLHLTGRDVTETKRMHEIMIQTEKMMSVGGLAAGMAHEINNPLSGILQSVQVIRRRLRADSPRNAQAAGAVGCRPESLTRFLEELQVPEFLANIQQAGERASSIVANMLEFSRRSQRDCQSTDVNALVEKVVALAASDFALSALCETKGIALRLNLDQDLPRARIIASEITQVLFNLIKNAVQALAVAPDIPEPTVWLRTRTGTGTVILMVEDNGLGVAPENARRIFEPFFTTKAPGEGTGLGLSVSYYIVTTHHGGAMREEERPGGGARFVIELPL